MNALELKALIGDDLSGLIKMINSTPSCLKIITQSGALISMNKVGLALIEAPDFDTVLGASVYDIVEESHREKFIAFNERICGGESGSLTFEIIGLNGTRRWMETYAAPYKLRNNEVVHLAITNDITKKIEAEEELKRKEHALIESSRLSALGEFVGGIAHEINNPLAIISSKASLLQYKLESGQADEAYLNKGLGQIVETVERISEIISNLKTYSRSPNLDNKSWHSVKPILEATLSLCSERFKLNNITIDNQITEDVQVYCQNVQLSQVFMNLLNNAFDAISELDKRWIRIEAESNDDQVRLFFTDSGSGIPDELSKEILKPFFTTKPPGKGTGLGLSISSNFMKTLNGRLFVNTNSPNTQFVLEFNHNSHQHETN